MFDTNFYNQICKRECRNTHHKLVMNSLQHLTCANADNWRSMFLRYFDLYLQGSKDPDTKFKDFRNHVLHVSDNFWGGPVKKAQKWYAATVSHLKGQDWKSAVYSAGVLSHYYMDPLMPLHTGQTEEEGVIHRACEWSVNKSFTTLIEHLESGSGYPDVVLPTHGNWLETAIHNGATLAHTHYGAFIDHYNLQLGVQDPPAGLDSHLREVTSQLLGYASVGFAKILERAISESAVEPVGKSSSMLKYFHKLTTPVSWFYKAYQHIDGRKSVRRIAAEYNAKGKVVNALPVDEKLVRKIHAAEVLKIDIKELDAQPIQPVGSKSTSAVSSGSRRQSQSRGKLVFRLNSSEPLEQAPSIGAKTAARFKAIQIETVGEFLAADAEETAELLNTRHIQTETILSWQIQSRLACRIPRIYGHDAQILAACGFETPEEIADSEPEMVHSLVLEFAKTDIAKYILRNGKTPDLKEVTNWVEWSKQCRDLKAA